MENTYTKEVIKELNEIKDTFGILAFERLTYLFFKMSEKYKTTSKSRDKWKEKYFKLKACSNDNANLGGEDE
jgi:hypothetical protein